MKINIGIENEEATRLPNPECKGEPARKEMHGE
jgi:hypothetical protein